MRNDMRPDRLIVSTIALVITLVIGAWLLIGVLHNNPAKSAVDGVVNSEVTATTVCIPASSPWYTGHKDPHC